MADTSSNGSVPDSKVLNRHLMQKVYSVGLCTHAGALAYIHELYREYYNNSGRDVQLIEAILPDDEAEPELIDIVDQLIAGLPVSEPEADADDASETDVYIEDNANLAEAGHTDDEIEDDLTRKQQAVATAIERARASYRSSGPEAKADHQELAQFLQDLALVIPRREGLSDEDLLSVLNRTSWFTRTASYLRSTDSELDALECVKALRWPVAILRESTVAPLAVPSLDAVTDDPRYEELNEAQRHMVPFILESRRQRVAWSASESPDDSAYEQELNRAKSALLSLINRARDAGQKINARTRKRAEDRLCQIIRNNDDLISQLLSFGLLKSLQLTSPDELGSNETQPLEYAWVRQHLTECERIESRTRELVLKGLPYEEVLDSVFGGTD